MSFFTVLRRAFAANPHTVPVGERESAKLAERGIHAPAIQTYFAWRRSLMLFVVFASLVSAGLAAYRERYETEERLDVLTTVAEHLKLDEKPIVAGALESMQEEDDEEMNEEDEEQEEEEEVEPEQQTAFGKFTDAVELIALYTLPPAALAVVLFWTRLKFTFAIMVGAFTFAFLVPMLIALCPWSWWGYVEPEYSPQTQPLEYFELQAEGVWEGAKYLVALLPTVLSLVPGVQRACIRVKLLLPQSMLPGFFLVAASPFYALFLFVVFVGINQFDSHPLFFAGMLLFLVAPLTYAVRSDIVTKPLSTPDDYRRIRMLQRIVGLLTLIAGGLLVAFLATREALGVRLLGIDYKTSLLVPLDIVEFLLETISRSMFITVLGADLFMRMNLTAWKHTRDFIGTAEAENYDRVMGELERIR